MLNQPFDERRRDDGADGEAASRLTEESHRVGIAAVIANVRFDPFECCDLIMLPVHPSRAAVASILCLKLLAAQEAEGTEAIIH